MDMASAVPDWLTPVAWTFLALSLLSTALVVADIHLAGRRHATVATELVFITSALYLGPFALPLYLRLGRAPRAAGPVRDTAAGPRGTAVAVLPGGGASAVAHLVAVPLVAAVGWTIAGMAMWPMILVIGVLAIAMLVVYERVASRYRGSARGRALSVGAALVAAVVTVVAFDVGMVGWMVLLHLNGLMPAITEGAFWFLMQVGVVVGLATGYPAVQWLLRREVAAAL